MAVSGPSQWATTLSTPCISSSISAAPCAASRLPSTSIIAVSSNIVPRRQVTNAPNSLAMALPCVLLRNTKARLVQ